MSSVTELSCQGFKSQQGHVHCTSGNNFHFYVCLFIYIPHKSTPGRSFCLRCLLFPALNSHFTWDNPIPITAWRESRCFQKWYCYYEPCLGTVNHCVGVIHSQTGLLLACVSKFRELILVGQAQELSMNLFSLL